MSTLLLWRLTLIFVVAVSVLFQFVVKPSVAFLLPAPLHSSRHPSSSSSSSCLLSPSYSWALAVADDGGGAGIEATDTSHSLEGVRQQQQQHAPLLSSSSSSSSAAAAAVAAEASTTIPAVSTASSSSSSSSWTQTSNALRIPAIPSRIVVNNLSHKCKF